MEIQSHRTAIRAVLIYLTVALGLVAIWILIAPHGFYDDFPGFGRHWVSALPPYNEHLERDYGAAGLGLATLTALAALWMDRRLIQATAITVFVSGAPHFAYHATQTEVLSVGDNIGTLVGLGAYLALPIGLLYLTSERVQEA